MDNSNTFSACVNTSVATNHNSVACDGCDGCDTRHKYFYSVEITNSDNGDNGENGDDSTDGVCGESGVNESSLRCMQSCGDRLDYSVLDVMSDQRSYKPSFNSRQMHNQKERMRRSRMKSSCEALRRMVPGVNDKTDKATVLEQTVNFLLHLSTCSGVNCTDYIPEMTGTLSSKSMQCYQQYVPSKAMIEYHDSLNLAQSRPFTELEHHFKQMEVEMCQNDANHMSGDMSGESDDHQMLDQTGVSGVASTARLVTTNDGRQFMVIDTIPTTNPT